ncbi:MAG TPA: hypothetical protein VME42_13300 [Steroidobacteraceae bacterium]|nr:hypothetical protein [Steroidobacteraceae bacterium]
MADPRCVAVCCYLMRDVAWNRCSRCRTEYGCLGFGSTAELVHFNGLIPASMLGEPLPLNLWPNLWKAIEPEAEASLRGESTPVRLLIAALGLKRLQSPAPPPNPDG